MRERKQDSRAGKEISVQCCGIPRKEFVMVPFGMYLNTELQGAKRGDLLVFRDRWRAVRREFIRSCTVSVSSALFDFMLYALYDGKERLSDLRVRWTSECIVSGLGERAYSDREVLLVYCKEQEIDNENNQDQGE